MNDAPQPDQVPEANHSAEGSRSARVGAHVRQRLKTLPVLPTLLTAGNLACGITAILLAVNGQLFVGCILVFAGMVCDMLDGKVARMTGQEGAFGAELDSLSDVVSFGVAPAILAHRLVLGYSAVFDHGERLLWFFAVFFPVMAAIRLARYNVEHSDGPTRFFRGLPSPGAASVVCSLIMLHQNEQRWFARIFDSVRVLGKDSYTGLQDLDAFRWILIAVTMVSALTMVSTIRFPHVGNMLSGRMSFRRLIILLLLGGVFVWKPVAALAVASTGYLLIGLGFGVFDAIRSMLAGRNPLDEEGDDEASDAGLVTEKPEADSGPAPGR
jgi:CDP-diacylglycerol---serine O-phosphatidyltransferase